MPLFKKKPKKENGLLDGAVNNAPPEPIVGIFVQWVKHEEQGEVVALYCETCRRTDFFLSPWSTKSDTPFWQYWKITLPCMTHESCFEQKLSIGTFKQTVMSPALDILNPAYKSDRPLGRLE